jgi:hypothetical protein
MSGNSSDLTVGLPPHDPLYELGLVLDLSIGMAVSQLWQSHRLFSRRAAAAARERERLF